MEIIFSPIYLLIGSVLFTIGKKRVRTETEWNDLTYVDKYGLLIASIIVVILIYVAPLAKIAFIATGMEVLWQINVFIMNVALLFGVIMTFVGLVTTICGPTTARKMKSNNEPQ